MPGNFIVANWKSYKTTDEAKNWFEKFSSFNLSTDKEIIICPSFTLLPEAKSLIENFKLQLKLGAQDISPFEEGPYTGEISGRQLENLASFVIVGHWERRTYFNEDDGLLNKKIEMARKFNITPIFCIQTIDTPIPEEVEIVAYEETNNIGRGVASDPKDIQMVSKAVKEKGIKFVLYGGSVNPEDVKNITSIPTIDGILVGSESLDAGEFLKIIANV